LPHLAGGDDTESRRNEKAPRLTELFKNFAVISEPYSRYYSTFINPKGGISF